MASDLKETLRDMIREVTEVDEIPDNTPFSELGIDSMMAIEIVAEVERTYKLSISEEELQKLTHFNAVFEAVSSKLGGSQVADSSA